VCVSVCVCLTRFTGGQGPHRLGPDLPDRAGPLQLLGVGSGGGLARGGHPLTEQQQQQQQAQAKLPSGVSHVYTEVAI